MQSALRKMLLEQSHSHWVTLNFHARYKPDVTQKKLRLWSLNLLDRLFAHRKFIDVPTADVFRFTAMPEVSLKGGPHFHMLVWVDPRCSAYFERIAARLWKSIVPSSTADIQQLKQTEADYQVVITYATKNSYLPRFSSAFVHSSMLDLPLLCHAPKPARQRSMRTSSHAP